MNNVLGTPVLTRRRIWTALAVAFAADGLQMLSGPIGIAGFDEAIDVAAMIAITLLIGFHPLFLPTFLVELLPVVDKVPTWTACVALVVALRRKQQKPPGPPPPPPPPPEDVIDV